MSASQFNSFSLSGTKGASNLIHHHHSERMPRTAMPKNQNIINHQLDHAQISYPPMAQQPPPQPPVQQPAQYLSQHSSYPQEMPQTRSTNPNGMTDPGDVRSRRMNQQASSYLSTSQPQPMRVTLPTRVILHPFRLKHEDQRTLLIFKLEASAFQQLNNSSIEASQNPNATAIHELQFRSYLVQPPPQLHRQGNSLLNKPLSGQSQLILNGKQCDWPESFQVSVNGNVIHLDRSKGEHRAANIFQFCQPGENQLDIQVNGCYCSHEFVIELVERPQLKSFIDTCFRSCNTSVEQVIQRLKFAIQSSFSPRGNKSAEIVSVFSGDGQEISKIKLSIQCPITGNRIITPARGQNCRHFQCFDLRKFLESNHERTLWSCPVCSIEIPYHMIEVDRLQLNILREISTQAMSLETDEILVDELGRWHSACPQQPIAYHPQASPNKTSVYSGPPSQLEYPHQSVHVPAEPVNRMPSQPTIAGRSPNNGHWQQNHQGPQMNTVNSQPVRRPLSAMSGAPTMTGRRSATSSPLQSCTKKPYAGQFASQQQQSNLGSPILQPNEGYHIHPDAQQPSLGMIDAPEDNLSPLAAMERAIIQQQQQMCPPPFDANVLTSQPSTSSTQVKNHIGPVQPPNSVVCGTQTSSQTMQSPNAAAFSPAAPSPVSRPTSMVPVSPQRSGSAANSDMSSLCPKQQTNLPGTPTSGHMLQVGPETPATPSSQHCGPNSVPTAMGQSPHLAGNQGGNGNAVMVDHQPLSNGSASAGSIISSSTMTPSTQSLGSVGMGGDGSRCGTAPLQSTSVGCSSSGMGSQGGNSVLGNHSDGEILSTGGSTIEGQSMLNKGASSSKLGVSIDLNPGEQVQFVDENNSDILMNKLMMNQYQTSHDQLNGSGSFEIGGEDQKWKQQLEARGKSEHLANFLSEPSMLKSKPQQPSDPMAQSQEKRTDVEGDDNRRSRSSSPIGRFDELGYLDSVENGAGLPPDESILELFER